MAEGGERGEVGREGTREAVGVKGENTEGGEAGESSVRNGTDEASGGEAKGDDGGAVGVARYASPIAGGGRVVPSELGRVQRLRDEIEQRGAVSSGFGRSVRERGE